MDQFTVFPLDTSAQRSAAAALSLAGHRALRGAQPWLPNLLPQSLAGMLDWVADHGLLLGWGSSGRLDGYLGGFFLEDFRNLGPGVFCPDFAHGFAPGVDQARCLTALYRVLAEQWLRRGYPVHSVGVWAPENPLLDALSLLGFGRIVVDLARDRRDLEVELALAAPAQSPSVRRAQASDFGGLEAWSDALAVHIGSPPVSMPGARGPSAAEWAQWWAQPDSLVWIVSCGATEVGYLKAADPQDDVTRAVHAPTTLAISGLWVDPAYRGRGAAWALLSALVVEAKARGKTLISVDCETTNPEAYGFWTRWFIPVTWSLERRYFGPPS